MKVTCRTCHRTYDDALRWDTCPHVLLMGGDLESWPADYDRFETAVQLVVEAYTFWESPLKSRFDLPAWLRSASVLLRGLDRLPKDAA